MAVNAADFNFTNSKSLKSLISALSVVYIIHRLMAITNQIRFDNLRGDIFGGVTAAIASLPLAFAFGAVIADSLTRTEHKSDKELIGQGIGNIMSGICGGLPGAGATMGIIKSLPSDCHCW